MFISSLTDVKDVTDSEVFCLLHLSLTKTDVYQKLGCFITNLRQKLNKSSAHCTEQPNLAEIFIGPQQLSTTKQNSPSSAGCDRHDWKSIYWDKACFGREAKNWKIKLIQTEIKWNTEKNSSHTLSFYMALFALQIFGVFRLFFLFNTLHTHDEMIKFQIFIH